MSGTIELPDAVYAALEKVAQASGATAADWGNGPLPIMRRGYALNVIGGKQPDSCERAVS
jgi:hypothetical protein